MGTSLKIVIAVGALVCCCILGLMVLFGGPICDLCVGIMLWWAQHTPFSYGMINVLLFIIIQPLAIVLFYVMTVMVARTTNRKTAMKLKRAATVIFVVLLVFGVGMVIIPLPFVI